MEHFDDIKESEESRIARLELLGLMARQRELIDELFDAYKRIGGAAGYMNAAQEERDKIKKLSSLLQDNNKAIDETMARIEGGDGAVQQQEESK